MRHPSIFLDLVAPKLIPGWTVRECGILTHRRATSLPAWTRGASAPGKRRKRPPLTISCMRIASAPITPQATRAPICRRDRKPSSPAWIAMLRPSPDAAPMSVRRGAAADAGWLQGGAHHRLHGMRPNGMFRHVP